MKTRCPGSVVVISVVCVLFAFAQPLSAVASADAATAADGEQVSPTTTVSTGISEGRGHFQKMAMNPYMMIPQLIALGFAPIVLANLKMMVMSALMINNMALNAAIFMTIRNMVFGPRPKIKYVNHGYRDHHRPHHTEQQHQYRDEQLLETSADGIETYDRRKRTVVAS